MPDAPLRSLDDLLRSAEVEHLSGAIDALTLGGLSANLERSGRVQLLSHLKEHGVVKLGDRQRIVNALSKAKRLGTLDPVDEDRTLREMPTRAAGAPAQALAERPAPSGPDLPRGVLRWVVDVKSWDPGEAEWALLLGLVSEEERTKTMKFHFREDQKRALVSRLLQRRACVEATGLEWHAVRIARTKGSKPFLANRPPEERDEIPNWNFNVSHEGLFVALAAEPRALCGVDVAAPEQARRGRGGGIEGLFKTMSDYFTPAEWRFIRSRGPAEPGLEAAFRRLWSLKEAFTKARGDGIGFSFSRCEFTLLGTTQRDDGTGGSVEPARISIDGARDDSWGFHVQPLSHDHWISTSRGPPTDAVDANGEFTATFRHASLSKAEMAAELTRPEPPFVVKRVADLIPTIAEAELATAVAADARLRGLEINLFN